MASSIDRMSDRALDGWFSISTVSLHDGITASMLSRYSHSLSAQRSAELAEMSAVSSHSRVASPFCWMQLAETPKFLAPTSNAMTVFRAQSCVVFPAQSCVLLVEADSVAWVAIQIACKINNEGLQPGHLNGNSCTEL